MRLQKLQLSRYGKFTDFDLDFQQKIVKKGTASLDFHVIYGANEAGKSTALAAYLDLLFGITHNSTYNFVHDYSSMKIGATVETATQTFELYRVKKRKNSLQNERGEIVPDTLLSAELGSLTREGYTSMFSLDDLSLQAGGESILASKGELGELLYSATTGIAHLGEALTGFKNRAAEFHKKGGRNTELQQLKLALSEIQEKRKGMDVQARDFARLVAERDERRRLFEKTNAAFALLRSRIKELRRQLHAKPLFDEYRQLSDAAEAYSSIPDAPSQWRDEIHSLEHQGTILRARRDGLLHDIDTQQHRLQNLSVDEVLTASRLLAAPMLEEIEPARRKYLAACEALPQMDLQREAIGREISALLIRLDQSQQDSPESLLLNATVSGSLREAMKSRDTLIAVQDAAERVKGDAVRAVKTAQLELQNAGTSEDLNESGGLAPENLSGEIAGTPSSVIDDLELALMPLEQNNPAMRMAIKQAELTDSDYALKQSLLQLSPWSGSADELSGMAVPRSNDINMWRETLASLMSQQSRLDHESELGADRIATLQAGTQSLGGQLGLSNDASYDAIRRNRDDAWKLHRKVLDDQTADAFEERMKQDDIAQSTKIQRSSDIAKLNQMSIELAESLAVEQQNRKKRQQLQTKLDTLTGKIKAAIANSSEALEPEMSLESYVEWLGERAHTLELASRSDAHRREMSLLRVEAVKASEVLSAALRAANLSIDKKSDATETLSLEIVSARKLIKRERELQGLRHALAVSKLQLQEREVEASDARCAIDSWTESWSALCSKCWFGQSSNVPSVESVHEILAQLSLLDIKLQERHSIEGRTALLSESRDQFKVQLGELANKISMGDAQIDIDSLYQQVVASLNDATATEQSRQQIQKILDQKAEELRELEESLEINRGHVNRFCDHFDVNDLTTVRDRLEELGKKADLNTRLAERVEGLKLTLGIADMAAIEQELECFDRVAAQNELQELENTESVETENLQQLHTAVAAAAERLNAVGGDDAVATLDQQRQTLLLELTEKATVNLEQRLGVLAAERALKVYRDKHRSSMLQAASEIFRIISNGHYTRLDTQSTHDSEKLIGVAADGSTKRSDQMSKGARFQLFLALRMAGYREFVKTRAPVPFIADDIMEAFDDVRAKAAFGELAKLAGVGQVIYLTHHEHLCDIALQACPDVVVHRLPN